MAAAMLALGAMAYTAQAQAGAHGKQYRITAGKGWQACEAYAATLNKLPSSVPAPICDLKLARVPGMQEPDWEELPVEQHLQWVYEIEQAMGRTFLAPEPLAEFEAWKRQREERVRDRNQAPRLRKARVAIADGGKLHTVLNYDVDRNLCRQAETMAGTKDYTDRYPFESKSSVFVVDDSTQKVVGGTYWYMRAMGELWLYRGKPYMFHQYLFGNQGKPDATLFVGRFEPIPPPTPGGMVYDLPGKASAPQYIPRPLCEIRFANPFENLFLK